MKFSAILKSASFLLLLLPLVSCTGTKTVSPDKTVTPGIVKLEKKYTNLHFVPFTAKPEISIDYPNAGNELQHSMMTTLQMNTTFANVSSGPATDVNDASTLIIKAEIGKMRIVSGTARFWGGAFAGSSGVEFDMELIDAASGKTVREEHMSSWNNAWAATYSGGSSDTQLLNDMGKITAQYIVDAMPAQ